MQEGLLHQKAFWAYAAAMGTWNKFRQLAAREDRRAAWSAAWGILAAVFAAGSYGAFAAATASTHVNHALVAVGVVLALIALCGLYLIFAPLLHTWPHHPLPQEAKTPSEIAPIDAAPVLAAPPAPSRDSESASLSGVRQLERLMAYYVGHTTFQADQLVSATIGTEFAVSGPVWNVDSQHVAIDGTDPKNTVHLWFAGDVSARLSMLQRGDPVGARGFLVRVGAKTASLHDCQFVDKA